jgi:hypothetical protein
MLVAMRDRGRLQRKMFMHDITAGRLGVALPGAILPYVGWARSARAIFRFRRTRQMAIRCPTALLRGFRSLIVSSVLLAIHLL